MKNIRVFSSENFQFSEVKFSIYLNRRVFVMMKHLQISNYNLWTDVLPSERDFSFKILGKVA